MIFKDKIALITGATGVIGRSIALELAKEGSQLILVSRSTRRLKELKKELFHLGFNVDIYSADVGNLKSVEKLFRSIRSRVKSLDILVAAAGIYGEINPLKNADIQKWTEAIQINLLGTVGCIKYALPFLIKGGRGKIITFAGGGEGASPNFSSYVSSKGAILRLVETLAEEFKELGVEINAISPGLVNSGFVRNIIKAGPRKAGKKQYQLAQDQLAGKAETFSPERTASLAVFLASSSSNGINGKNISAIYDPWKEFPDYPDKLWTSDVYNWRRIKPEDRGYKFDHKLCTKHSYKIATIGLWHLGSIYSVGLAELGHRVVGIDNDNSVIKNFSKNVSPLAEPQIEELLKSNQAEGRLNYSTDFSLINNQDVIWMTYDSPVDKNDRVDLSIIFDAVNKAVPFLRDDVLIVVSSQLPIGASQKIRDFIVKKRPNLKFDYAYLPENLRLGSAMQCFFYPERIVVGFDSPAALERIKDIFFGLPAKILPMSIISAEMTKYALNAFLATSLSFTYDIADACEALGADVVDVVRALRADSRIGEKSYLDASIGFSGGTLGRDLVSLLAAIKSKNVELPVIQNVLKKNSIRKNIVSRRLASYIGNLRGKTITIFGLTYKSGTNTLRNSLALAVASDLQKNGAHTKLYDSRVDRLGIFRDPYRAASGSSAIVVMTPLPEFKSLDFQKLRRSMKEPAIFFDTRNFFYDQESSIRSASFNYLGIGR